MAMNHHLFTGQCESVGETHVTNTTTANDGVKSKILPTHAGTSPVRRHRVPRAPKK
ncbi:MAG: hypothetical protein MJY98_12620 [Fibrobacter sp.]|nr:hypothetical protein [Fibrobacter sp.]